MIQTTITHTCPDCGSIDIVKNGHDYKGDQKLQSLRHIECSKGLCHERREQVKRAVLERVSMRGIGRIFNYCSNDFAKAVV